MENTFSENAETAVAPATLFESSAELAENGGVDRFVIAAQRRAGVHPARLCSDAVFVRRAYLDVIGTLPTAREAADFLQDASPAKRADLIDRLLARSEFADYWAMKWGDLLRVKAEFPINLWPNAAQAYSHWIRDSIRDNKRYDDFVREMLTANGSNFRVAPVNFYRAMQSRDPRGIAQAVALTFMGTRADKWPESRLRDMSVFFSQIGYKSTGEWKEEIVFFDTGKQISLNTAVFPDGRPVKISPDQDLRAIFANWLVSPNNPWFARAVVNRIWAWLMGRGLVQEPDDIRDDNPPSIPELLTYLERELIAAKFDLRHVYALILKSDTYQLSSIPRTNTSQAEALFAYYSLRRLDAEVLIDAVCQVTGTGDEYMSQVAEPFTVMPEGTRAITLPDGSITSAFLELFGRPPRDTGLEAERNNRPSAAQRLHLLNSTHIQKKIETSPTLRTVAQGTNGRSAVDGLYLAILSRYPTDDEKAAVRAYSESGAMKKREAFVDLAWALMNTAEFWYRH